jgi:hypothetical protein
MPVSLGPLDGDVKIRKVAIAVVASAVLIVGATVIASLRQAPIVTVGSFRGVVVQCDCGSDHDWMPSQPELATFEKAISEHAKSDPGLRSVNMSESLDRYVRRYEPCQSGNTRILNVMFVRDDARSFKNWRSRTCWSAVGGGLSYWSARYDFRAGRILDARSGGEL